ncbi:MAG TPA: glycosyl hydrolase family 18 protein [Mycobacteriales bacterium]|nr:glycosyl hydrolase family 18 protein [Mycobacteriales bacterium]HWC34190.1 glycosyl hydrolase family 18 protein [Mycobacteriales bacterium]
MRGRRAAIVRAAMSGVTGLSLAALPAAVAGRSAAPPARVLITGFHEAGDANGLITRSAAALTTVGVDGVSITRTGGGVHEPDAAAVRAEHVAQQHGLRAEFLVSNWAGGFSPGLAHRLLSSPRNIDRVAAKLAQYVEDQNWDGVSIDLESLHNRDASGLVSFLQALRSDLAAGRTLSICISNSITSAEYRHRGYDLAGVAATVDRIILMAYDQHGPWEHKPGPVGALAWQRKGLNVMRLDVPAAQIDLGQAGYGYAWRPNGTHSVSDARARQLVAQDHATAHWRSQVGEWTAHLSDGTTIWWADARSLQLRLDLARARGLHGIAVWDLAESDPITQ